MLGLLSCVMNPKFSKLHIAIILVWIFFYFRTIVKWLFKKDSILANHAHLFFFRFILFL